MNTLHTVNKPDQPLQLCLRALNPDDAILLIEDGIYNITSHQIELQSIPQAIYVLADDLKARGIKNHHYFTTVNYHEFAQLTEQYDRVLSWF